VCRTAFANDRSVVAADRARRTVARHRGLQSRRNHQGTELEGCNGHGVLMIEGKDILFAENCAPSDITIIHDGKLTKIFFPTENQRQRKPLATPCHQSLIITLLHLPRLLRNIIHTTVIIPVLQEMRHPSINIPRIVRRGTPLSLALPIPQPFTSKLTSPFFVPQACLSRCLNLYMAAFDQVSKSYVARITKERASMGQQAGAQGGLELL
jgi:hypothetical protein